MGKKSKNPRKAKKSSKDRNPLFRAVDEILANSMPREGLPPPPAAAVCPHMEAETANMDRLEQLRNELKEYQGRRCSRDGNRDKVIFWAIKSRIRDGYYRNMLDLVLATATDYLLQYDCSSTDSDIHWLIKDLILVACVLDEVDEGYGIMEEADKKYKNVWATIPDLFNKGAEKSGVHGKTELSMIRFVYKKTSCKCLKALKKELNEKHGLQFETCKNNQCQKVGELDELCSGCLRAYCSQACRKADWDNGKHGGFCKPRSGKRAVKRLNRLAEIFPNSSFEIIEQLGEEAKNNLFQALDKGTEEEISELAKMFHESMNVDEQMEKRAPPGA